MPMKRHKSVARLFDEDFGRRNDEVRTLTEMIPNRSLEFMLVRYLF